MPPFMQPGKQPGGDFRQNLDGATGGTIKGANGGVQKLGAAALRRLGNPGAATGPNTKGGGLNPAAGPPGVRTPPIMDPAQNPNASGPSPLPGFLAQPGMTPYQLDGGGGAVGASTPGDPGAKLSTFGPGTQMFQPPPGMQPPSDGNGQGGAANMGGAGPQAALIAKLSGGYGTSLPGFQPAIDIGHAPGAEPGGPMTMNGDPGSTPWMPPGAGGDMKPDLHGGGGALGGPPSPFNPGDRVPSPDGRPLMNTKPMPGRRMIPPEGGSPWAGLAGAGGGAQGPINSGVQKAAGTRRGMASF